MQLIIVKLSILFYQDQCYLCIKHSVGKVLEIGICENKSNKMVNVNDSSSY